MNLKVLTPTLFYGLAAALLVPASTASAAVLTDAFTSQFDYSGGAVQGIWSGSYNMGNLGAGGIVGASPTFPDNGLLVFDFDTNSGWEGGRSDAPFLYVDVPGNQDFTAEVTIAAQTSGFWSDAGIIARAKSGTGPGTGADQADENFTFFGSFRTDNANMNAGTTLHKRIENGAQVQDANIAVTAADEPLPIRLRLVKTGSTYEGFVSPDNGTTWQLQSTAVATAGTALADPSVMKEVGLAFSPFDGALMGAAKFDNFYLSIVPEPSAFALALVGTASLAVRRWRRR